jgi:hypothetical protein
LVFWLGIRLGLLIAGSSGRGSGELGLGVDEAERMRLCIEVVDNVGVYLMHVQAERFNSVQL